jgi:hypothetical protein
MNRLQFAARTNRFQLVPSFARPMGRRQRLAWRTQFVSDFFLKFLKIFFSCLGILILRAFGLLNQELQTKRKDYKVKRSAVHAVKTVKTVPLGCGPLEEQEKKTSDYQKTRKTMQIQENKAGGSNTP